MHQTSLADAERRCCVINWRQSRIFAVVAVLAALMLAVACAPDDNDDDNDVNDVDDTPIVELSEHEDYGTILVDSEGWVLYVFANDDWEEGVSNCVEGCAAAWPPLSTDAEEPLIGEGVPGVFTAIEHPELEDESQLAVDGMPLYYWENEEAPGDAGGLEIENWLILVLDEDEDELVPWTHLDDDEENGDNDE